MEPESWIDQRQGGGIPPPVFQETRTVEVKANQLVIEAGNVKVTSNGRPANFRVQIDGQYIGVTRLEAVFDVKQPDRVTITFYPAVPLLTGKRPKASPADEPDMVDVPDDYHRPGIQ